MGMRPAPRMSGGDTGLLRVLGIIVQVLMFVGFAYSTINVFDGDVLDPTQAYLSLLLLGLIILTQTMKKD